MTGYNLQIRYYDQPPNMTHWVWRITDNDGVTLAEPDLGTIYRTRIDAISAGQDALDELVAIRKNGSDHTQWHTVNEPDRRRQHPLNANPTTMDGLVWGPDRSEPGGY